MSAFSTSLKDTAAAATSTSATSTTALDDALEKQVLFDLFSRLPTATLVYSCRFACLEWKRIIEVDMHTLWEKRARAMLNAAQTTDFGASQMLPRTVEQFVELPNQISLSPMSLCIALIKQAYKRWHVERVLRSWRKESRKGLVPLHKYWHAEQQRAASMLPKSSSILVNDSGAENAGNFDSRIHTLAVEMSEQLDRVFKELDERILEDSSDAHIEAHLQSLANQSSTAFNDNNLWDE
jgi:hypothetical protein